MNKVFEKLKGLNLEDGAKIIRTAFPEIREQSIEDSDNTIDFDFMLSEGNYFNYRTTFETVEGDAPNIDTENGSWSAMIDGDHKTHPSN
jgi:hypothetical protein